MKYTGWLKPDMNGPWLQCCHGNSRRLIRIELKEIISCHISGRWVEKLILPFGEMPYINGVLEHSGEEND